MNKLILTLIFAGLSISVCKAQLFHTSKGTISFHSSTPVEDINAVSNQASGVVSVPKKEVAFLVNMRTFDFPNNTMETHFNEKYVESDKYPHSSFRGKILEDIDLSKDGEYKVTADGKLNVHGVEQERKIPGIITVKNGIMKIKSEFEVRVADHKITIPRLVVKNIAEVITVKVDMALDPKK